MFELIPGGLIEIFLLIQFLKLVDAVVQARDQAGIFEVHPQSVVTDKAYQRNGLADRRFFKHSRQYLGHLPAPAENVNILPHPLHFLVILWSGAFILHSWQRSGQY